MSLRPNLTFMIGTSITGRQQSVGFYQAPWPVRAPPAAVTADGSMLVALTPFFLPAIVTRGFARCHDGKFDADPNAGSPEALWWCIPADRVSVATPLWLPAWRPLGRKDKGLEQGRCLAVDQQADEGSGLKRSISPITNTKKISNLATFRRWPKAFWSRFSRVCD